MKSFEKISIHSRENKRNDQLEDHNIGESLPQMNRLGMRKNTRSNARNAAKIEQLFYEKSKSQRRAIPLINPINVQKSDFRLSGMIKGRNIQRDPTSDNQSSHEAERVLHMRHKRFKPKTHKKLINLNPYENTVRKAEGAKVGFYVFPFANDERNK